MGRVHTPRVFVSFAVAYIGDLDSEATELSLPILNQAGIVQLTPGSPYPGLTDHLPPVTLQTEPHQYYPQGGATLLRLIPNDLVQAGAAIDWLKSIGCHAVAAAGFGSGTEPLSMVTAIEKTAALPHYKLPFIPTSAPGNNSKTYYTYAAALRAKGVNCFVLTGHVTRAAVALTTELKAQLPAGAVILGTSGFCNAAWSDHSRGGVPATVDGSLYCTTPVLPLDDYPQGRRFVALALRALHREPSAYTYYGYLAGSLLVRAIRDVSAGADPRKQVMYNVVNNFASDDLQTFTFDTDGDLSGGPVANTYGLDRILDGIPRPYKVLNPPRLLQSAS